MHARFSSLSLLNVSVNKQPAANNNKIEYTMSQFITRQNFHITVALSAFYSSVCTETTERAPGSIVSPGLWLSLQRSFLQLCSHSVHSNDKWQVFWAGWHRPEEIVTVGWKRGTFDHRYTTHPSDFFPWPNYSADMYYYYSFYDHVAFIPSRPVAQIRRISSTAQHCRSWSWYANIC